MRGKATLFLFFGVHRRITPAYAGKSFAKQKKSCNGWDHPRLCGEKCGIIHGRSHFVGSPPPMRGKGLGNPFSHRQVGITPAYAGKSSSFFAISSACWDHPRLCGEKPQTAVLFLRRSGSPPPMRGKAVSSLVSSTLSRITPAYAGKRNAPWSGRTPF